MGKELQDFVLNLLGARTICFNEHLRYMLKSINAAIFLHKIMWWYGKSRGAEIYKTADECERETTLTTSQQETAIKILMELRIIDYSVRGIPPIRHFKLNKERLIELCEQYAESLNQKAENEVNVLAKTKNEDLEGNSEKDLVESRN